MRVALLALLLLACPHAGRAGETLVLRGGTRVDLSDLGRSTRDVRDSLIVVSNGRILAAGTTRDTAIPDGARVVDVSGTWIVPGLNDVFATLNNQAQANAYLYLGVTGIVGSDEPGGRRGPLFLGSNPGPRIYPMDVLSGVDESALDTEDESVYEMAMKAPRLDPAQLRAEIDRKHAAGARVLLLYYTMRPDQLAVAARHARARGMATIGELGASHYRDAIRADVDAFVHTSRYSLDLAPAGFRAEVALSPFGPPRRRFYEFLMTVREGSPALSTHARLLASGRTALIPTLAMNYLDLPGHLNPWRKPVAALLDPDDIHLPADRDTGISAAAANAVRDGFPAGASQHLTVLERAYCRAGARYLAGSGTDAFGTMAGISLHVELAQLVAACLTPRQALAAATTNVGEGFGWPAVGRIAEGANADLLVLEGDPTRDLANLERIRHLVLDGALVDRAALLNAPVAPKPDGAGPIARRSPDVLRVMSWNVAKDSIFPEGSDGYSRHERFARVLRAVRPDIACLQEVYAGGARAAALFDDLLPLPGGRRWQHHGVLDNVILARHDLGRRDARTLDVGEGRQRGHAMAQVDVPGDADPFLFCAHFQSGAGARVASRERQADLVGEHIRALQGPDGLPRGTPIVVLGDLNAIASLPATFVDNLRQGRTGDGSASAGRGPDWDGSDLEDAQPRHNGRGEQTWTWRVDGTGFPPGALDRILYTGSVLALDRAFVLDTQDMDEDELRATGLERGDEMYRIEKGQHDHLPLVADFLPASSR